MPDGPKFIQLVRPQSVAGLDSVEEPPHSPDTTSSLAFDGNGVEDDAVPAAGCPAVKGANVDLATQSSRQLGEADQFVDFVTVVPLFGLNRGLIHYWRA